MNKNDYERLASEILDEEEIAALSRFGRKRTLAAGEHLFCTGDRDLSVFLVLHGEAEVYFMRGGKERKLVVLGQGHFVGDISMLTRMASVVSVQGEGRVGGDRNPGKRIPICPLGSPGSFREDH